MVAVCQLQIKMYQRALGFSTPSHSPPDLSHFTIDHRKERKASDPFQIYFRGVDQYMLNTNFEKLQRPLLSFVFFQYWSFFTSSIQSRCGMDKKAASEVVLWG